MKLLGRQGDNLVVTLRLRDREQWVFLLQRYPVSQPSDHRLSSPASAEALTEEQEMLEEALTEQQMANRTMIERFVQERLAPSAEEDENAPRAMRLTLTREEVDWLLEVINDVRVGFWTRLGRPGPEQLHSAQLMAAHPFECASMEMAAWVQSFLLGALESASQ